MAKNNKLNEEQILRIELIEKASKSLKDYMNLIDVIRDKELNINHIKKQYLLLEKENIELEKQKKILLAASNSASKTELAIILKKIKANEKGIKQGQEAVKYGEEELEIHKEALAQVNLRVAAYRSVRTQVKAIGKLLYQQRGWLYEQQKSVKETELSMGILSNQAKGFRQNIYKASLTTTAIGVDTKDLAKLQGTYSDNIGRSVQLTEEQLIAMGNLAKGTVLGVEGAAELAANMENFGISAQGSVDLIESMLKTSHKMGVDSSKVIKNLQKNMGLAQKYHFKGGINGLAKMASIATKFKFDMADLAGFAEKLITPEGAVEAAAQLQVLGGAWAQLGDPFELMFRARNDLKGLQDDIIAATTATARFDKVSGEITIDPMELHRLRAVANATGLSFENLATTAREVAKLDFIKGKVSGFFDTEDKDYIAQLSTFNAKTKKYEVVLQREDGTTIKENVDSLREITKEMIKSHRATTSNLEARAKQALTFEDTLNNLKNTFKSLLLPGFEAFTKALQNQLGKFTDWVNDKKIFNKMADFGEKLGDFVGKVINLLGGSLLKGLSSFVDWATTTKAWSVMGYLGKTIANFIENNPLLTLGTVLGGWVALKVGAWIANGIALGASFVKTVRALGGVGGGVGNMTKGAGGLFNGGAMVKGGGAAGFGKNIGIASKSAGAIGGGVLSAGFAGYNEYQENKEMGIDTGENVTRTLAKGGGAGLGAWGGAATGAAIGTAALPVIGTAIGGIIGGIVGAWGGGALGEEIGDGIYGEEYRLKGKEKSVFNKQNDFVSRPGKDPIPFSSKDTLLGAKKGGPIDRMITDKEKVKPKPDKNTIPFNPKDLIIGEKKDTSMERLVNQLINNHKKENIIDKTPQFNAKDLTFNTRKLTQIDKMINQLIENKEINKKESIIDKTPQFNAKDLTFNTRKLTQIDKLINKLIEDKEVDKEKTTQIIKPFDNKNNLIDKGIGLKLIDELKAKNLEKEDIKIAKPKDELIGKGIGLELFNKIKDKFIKKEPEVIESKPGKNDTYFDAKKIFLESEKAKINQRIIESKKEEKAIGGKVLLEFGKPLKIEGKIQLDANGKSAEIDLNDSIMIRDLSKVIQEQLSKAIGGGKMSSNPVVI